MIFVKTSAMKAEIIFAIFKIIFLSGGVAAATFSGKQRSLLEGANEPQCLRNN